MKTAVVSARTVTTSAIRVELMSNRAKSAAAKVGQLFIFHIYYLFLPIAQNIITAQRI